MRQNYFVDTVEVTCLQTKRMERHSYSGGDLKKKKRQKKLFGA